MLSTRKAIQWLLDNVVGTPTILEGQVGDLVQGGCIGVIQKPFTLEVLSRQVAYAIGQRREPAAGNARPPGDPAP